jgi:chromosome transmission fidelity protein 1
MPAMQVTAQAHALILASGTLAPVSALTTQLFPGTQPASIGRFACGHVVPPRQLLALALGETGNPVS